MDFSYYSNLYSSSSSLKNPLLVFPTISSGIDPGGIHQVFYNLPGIPTIFFLSSSQGFLLNFFINSLPDSPFNVSAGFLFLPNHGGIICSTDT